MTSPISANNMTTSNPDATRPRTEKPSSRTETTADAKSERTFEQANEPTLSRAGQASTQASQVSAKFLANADEAKTALDAYKESVAARPSAVLAASGRLDAAQVQALLQPPAN